MPHQLGKCGFPPVLCRSKHDEIASKVLELEMTHDCGSQLFATTKVEKRQNIDSSAKSDRPVCSRLYPPVIDTIKYRVVSIAIVSCNTLLLSIGSGTCASCARMRTNEAFNLQAQGLAWSATGGIE